MLDALRAYYEAQGISATRFKCPHQAECRMGCQDFTSAKAAFVSTGYEAHTLPRVLFLSSDPGSGEATAKQRTIEGVRHQEEVLRDVYALHRGRHWSRTHQMACVLLDPFGPGITEDDVRHHFAHANVVKCSVNNPDRSMAPEWLYRNCARYVPGEMEVLQPDVLVTQGMEPRDVIESSFARLPVADYLPSRLRLPEIAVIQIAGRPVLWIWTYHPRYGVGFKRNRDSFSTYQKAVAVFVKDSPAQRSAS